jgi:hypothetical protein
MKKTGTLIVALSLLCIPVLHSFGAPAASGFMGDGFFLRLGCGVPIPLGLSGQVLTVGVSPVVVPGYQLTLGPGRLKAGLDLGCLIEFTRNLPSIDQYTSFFLPLGVLVGYDLRIGAGFYAFAEAQVGYSPTLVFYQLSSMGDLGVWKPYVSGGLGAGLELGMFSLQAGARLFVVFYDTTAYLSIAPELRGEIRFPVAGQAKKGGKK